MLNHRKNTTMKILLWLVFLIFPPENPVASPGFSGPAASGLAFLTLQNDKVQEPAKRPPYDLHHKTNTPGRSLTICKSQRNKVPPTLYPASFQNPLCLTGSGLYRISDNKPGNHFTIYQLGKNNFEQF
jgi:hypothetical protein